jgi:hypothetical protein
VSAEGTEETEFSQRRNGAKRRHERRFFGLSALSQCLVSAEETEGTEFFTTEDRSKTEIRTENTLVGLSESRSTLLRSDRGSKPGSEAAGPDSADVRAAAGKIREQERRSGKSERPVSGLGYKTRHVFSVRLSGALRSSV